MLFTDSSLTTGREVFYFLSGRLVRGLGMRPRQRFTHSNEQSVFTDSGVSPERT